MNGWIYVIAIWAVVALLIWGWALASSRGGGGDGEAVFLAIVFGVGLSWPVVIAGLVLGLIVFILARRRRPRLTSWN